MDEIKKQVAIFLENVTGIPRGIFNVEFIWTDELTLTKDDLSIVRDDIFEEYGIKVPYKVLEKGSIESVSVYIEKHLPI